MDNSLDHQIEEFVEKLHEMGIEIFECAQCEFIGGHCHFVLCKYCECRICKNCNKDVCATCIQAQDDND